MSTDGIRRTANKVDSMAAGVAARLDGMQHPLVMPPELKEAAVTAGLVIVYGTSDDLMEFDGAIEDELGCYGSGVALLDEKGLLPDFDSLDKEDKDVLREYFRREQYSVSITASWCAEPGYSWTYQTTLPHAEFTLQDGGEPYCRGIVISMLDVVWRCQYRNAA